MKKKIAMLLIAGTLLMSLSGCQASSGGEGQDGGNSENTYEIALITSQNGAIDDQSFTQGSWEGIQKFSDETGKTCQYYEATDESVNGYTNAIQVAIDNGADTVVLPGYAYEETVYDAQDKYPDVSFILLDGTPHNADYSDYHTADNTYTCVFAEQQAGFLAGYAIVKDGETNLGFLGGMKGPAVVRYGYGFAQGADYAARELGLQKGDVTLKFGYTGNFDTSPENQTKAASWYRDGATTIFSCGGNIVYSVTAAAEAADGEVHVIGVDVDQAGISDTIVTSAMKMLSTAVYNALEAKEAGEFPGGQNDVLGVEDDAVGLPDDFSRFSSFTKEDYDAIYQKLLDDEDGILSGMISDTDENGEEITIDMVQETLEVVTIEEVE